MAARVVVKATMTGDKEMIQKLRAIAGDKGMRKVARASLLELAEEKVILVKARTPIRTGKLLSTIRGKILISAKREDLRAAVLAGGPEAPYARIVHETHPRQSKYLESVILEAAPTAARDLAAKIDMKQVAAAA